MVKQTKNNKRLKNKKNKKNKMTKKICAPHVQNDPISCFSRKSLLEMIKMYNEKTNNSSQKIFKNISPENLEKKTRKQLHQALEEKMKSSCNDEQCWVNNVLKTKQFNKELKPVYPKKWKKNKNTWLTTYDIENVLKQYQTKHNDFLFLGAVPIDFDSRVYSGNCVSENICNLNVEKMKQNGKTKLGIVFNLDKHDQPGSHWIAMYCDFSKGELNFFDSYAEEPPTEVIVLMERLQRQNEELGVQTLIINNEKVHQHKNSECGMYCIYFIVERLEGRPMSYFNNNRIADDNVEKKRTLFFYKD